MQNTTSFGGGDVKTPNFVCSRLTKEKVVRNSQFCLFRVAKGEESGQPAASDMRELVWDDELEAIAQR